MPLPICLLHYQFLDTKQKTRSTRAVMHSRVLMAVSCCTERENRVNGQPCACRIHQWYTSCCESTIDRHPFQGRRQCGPLNTASQTIRRGGATIAAWTAAVVTTEAVMAIGIGIGSCRAPAWHGGKRVEAGAMRAMRVTGGAAALSIARMPERDAVELLNSVPLCCCSERQAETLTWVAQEMERERWMHPRHGTLARSNERARAEDSWTRHLPVNYSTTVTGDRLPCSSERPKRHGACRKTLAAFLLQNLHLPGRLTTSPRALALVVLVLSPAAHSPCLLSTLHLPFVVPSLSLRSLVPEYIVNNSPHARYSTLDDNQGNPAPPAP